MSNLHLRPPLVLATTPQKRKPIENTKTFPVEAL